MSPSSMLRQACEFIFARGLLAWSVLVFGILAARQYIVAKRAKKGR